MNQKGGLQPERRGGSFQAWRRTQRTGPMSKAQVNTRGEPAGVIACPPKQRMPFRLPPGESLGNLLNRAVVRRVHHCSHGLVVRELSAPPTSELQHWVNIDPRQILRPVGDRRSKRCGAVTTLDDHCSPNPPSNRPDPDISGSGQIRTRGRLACLWMNPATLSAVRTSLVGEPVPHRSAKAPGNRTTPTQGSL